ncbi:MAG TPA: nucleoside hydrolase [Amnibacterium sp.]|nr:nucleoside hydrolase [Amnibacterium sp.]
MPRPPEPAPIYLDCDTGIDDALTLGYLVAAGADLVGVGSVSGNVAAGLGARNSLDVLALIGRADVPVAVGAHDPIGGVFHGGAPGVHGANGIGDVELPASSSRPTGETAAAMLSRLARRHAGRLHVLAVGPLTNLALALDADPELAQLVAGVTIMGGAALVPGNVTAVAEANIFNDVLAAARVLAAEWPVTVVGLDVTMEARFEQRHLDVLLAGPPAARALGEMLPTYFRYYTPVLGRPSCALHDPLAAAVALGALTPTLAPVVPVEVDTTDGPGRGQTIADLRSRFLGYPPLQGTRHRVVLEVPAGFGDTLAESLLRL